MASGTIVRLLTDKGFGFVSDEAGVEHFLALLTSKWVEVQVGATRSYAIWAVTA